VVEVEDTEQDFSEVLPDIFDPFFSTKEHKEQV